MSGIIAQNTLDNTGLIKSPAGGGAWTFIKKLTASTSADLTFVDGTSDVVLDSTYKEYLFYIINWHPGTVTQYPTFNGSSDTGSNYNVAKTTTTMSAYNSEGSADGTLAQDTGSDLAQGTGYQRLTAAGTAGVDNDHASSGYLHLFNPSSTTFVKHFMARMAFQGVEDYIMDAYIAGYFNTTSVIDAIQFKMTSGNIDSGDIFLHGLTT